MPLLQVPEIKLRVMSLNMQYGAGPEVRDHKALIPFSQKEQDHHLNAIVDLIDEVNPHIVNLQEVDKNSSRTHFTDQLMEIVNRLAKKQDGRENPYHFEFGSCMDFDQNRNSKFWEKVRHHYSQEKSEWIFKKLEIPTGMLPAEPVKIHFGNAILSRYPLREKHHSFFTPPYWDPWMSFNIVRRKDERKSLLVCRVNYCPEIAEKVPLFIYNTHLEYNHKKNRIAQSKILYGQLSKREHSYKILAGDFNAEPLGENYDLESGAKDESLERLLRHPELKYWKNIAPIYSGRRIPNYAFATYPSLQPERIIDTIMAPRFAEITNYFVHPTHVSDHLAVIADITLRHDLVPESALKQLLNPWVENS